MRVGGIFAPRFDAFRLSLLASYAIQDTPDTVAEHYGRFLPHDKAALAAQILNQVWTT